MSYEVKLSDTAQSNLESLDKQVRKRIVLKLENIRENPLDHVKRLRGAPLFSLRVGDYRVVMDIKPNQKTILVMRAGHRSRIYDEL